MTSIELEHTDKLGSSLAEIAYEKAGILKPGVPAVAGDLPVPARAVLSDRARELGTEVAWLGTDFDVEVRSWGPEGLALRLTPAVALDAWFLCGQSVQAIVDGDVLVGCLGPLGRGEVGLCRASRLAPMRRWVGRL